MWGLRGCFHFCEKSAIVPTLRRPAIGRSQAVIEFGLDGSIIDANSNFLDALGYSLAEIKGKHHSLFVPVEERDSAAYREFWAGLKSRRIPSRTVQARAQGRSSDLDPGVIQPDPGRQGRPDPQFIKFATDITEQKDPGTGGRRRDCRHRSGSGDHRVRSRRNDPLGQPRTFSRPWAIRSTRYVAGITACSSMRRPAGAQNIRKFWATLNRGQYLAARIQALCEGRPGSLDPCLVQSYLRRDRQAGQSEVKFSSDLTKQKLEVADTSGQVEAIRKSLAVIEFAMDGTIRRANRNFLRCDGVYSRRGEGQAPPHVRQTQQRRRSAELP